MNTTSTAPRIVPIRAGISLPLPPLASAVRPEHSFTLRIFDRIPEGFGAVEVGKTGGGMLRPGEVAVYEQHWDGCISTDDLIEGEIYVREHQRVSAPGTDTRRAITRKLVRIYRATGETAKGLPSDAGECWYARNLNAPFRRGEGPYYDWALASTLIGRVVGIYSPGHAGGEG